jgi:Smg protein
MFDILVYLFEMYAQHGGGPEVPAPGVLMRKLSAVGFEQEDISAALEWLSGLENFAGEDASRSRLADTQATRIYSMREMARLPVECRGFLAFLEDTEVIDGMLRELIIERAMALRDLNVPLDKLKIIVLMVLWRRHPTMEALDGLLLEELLSAENALPVLH